MIALVFLVLFVARFYCVNFRCINSVNFLHVFKTLRYKLFWSVFVRNHVDISKIKKISTFIKIELFLEI